MKRFLLPSLCAALLVGCDGDDPKSLLADKLDGSAAKSGLPTNNVATEVAIEPPKTPPALPEPVREVLKLAQTSVSEGVLVDFIGTIRESFSLNADQIIYLTDLGLTGPTLQALLKHAPAGDTTGAPPAVAVAPLSAPATPVPLQPPTATAPQTLAASGGPAPAPNQAPVIVAAPATEVTYNTFYDSLSSYGSWVEVPEYGWCWQPSVATVNPSWQPYADNGGWVWSDVGWYWNSYYSWGWAPFHYGRWHRAGFGWCWVPDVDWAPAWVTWRSSNAYCGWAPLPPGARWSVGVGLTWNGRHAASDCAFGLYADSFVYLGWNRFADPRPWHHYVPRNDVPHIYAQTKIINDFHERGGVKGPGRPGPAIVNNGPGVAPVQAHVPGGVSPVHLSSASQVPTAAAVGLTTRAGQSGPGGGVLPVYRPTISSSPAAIRPTPSPLALASRPGAPVPATGFVGPNPVPRDDGGAPRLPGSQPGPAAGPIRILGGSDTGRVPATTVASTRPVTDLRQETRTLTGGAAANRGPSAVPRDDGKTPRLPGSEPIAGNGPVHILGGPNPGPGSTTPAARTGTIADLRPEDRNLTGQGIAPRTGTTPSTGGPVIVPQRNPTSARIPPTVYRPDLEGAPAGPSRPPAQITVANRAGVDRQALGEAATPVAPATGGQRPLASASPGVSYNAPSTPVYPSGRTVYGQDQGGYSVPARNFSGTTGGSGSSGSSYSGGSSYSAPAQQYPSSFSAPSAASGGGTRSFSSPQPNAPVYSSPTVHTPAPANNSSSSGGNSGNNRTGNSNGSSNKRNQ